MPRAGSFGSASWNAFRSHRPRTQWNPLDKAAAINLSALNMTATNSTATTFSGVRANNSAGGSKVQFEITVNVGSFNNGAGFANLLETITAGNSLGQAGNNSLGWFPTAGVAINNVNGVGGIGGWAVGDVLGFCIDNALQQCSFYRNGGAIIGTVSIAAIGGKLFPACNVYNATDQFTLNPFPAVLKAGYSPLG